MRRWEVLSTLSHQTSCLEPLTSLSTVTLPYYYLRQILGTHRVKNDAMDQLLWRFKNAKSGSEDRSLSAIKPTSFKNDPVGREVLMDDDIIEDFE